MDKMDGMDEVDEVERDGRCRRGRRRSQGMGRNDLNNKMIFQQRRRGTPTPFSVRTAAIAARQCGRDAASTLFGLWAKAALVYYRAWMKKEGKAQAWLVQSMDEIGRSIDAAVGSKRFAHLVPHP